MMEQLGMKTMVYAPEGRVETLTRSIYRIFLDILSLFCVLYRKKIYLACTSLLGVETLKRIVFVPNVVFLVHDLPCVFTLKHDIIKNKM
jgi:hypothetical protein